MLSLIHRAQQYSDRIAIHSDGEDFTYQQLLADSARVASKLLAGRPDLSEARIAFLVPPGYAYVAVQWGIWRAGGIAVPLCTLHPEPAMRYVLEDTGADTLVVHPHYAALLQETANQLDISWLPLTEAYAEEATTLPEISTKRRAMILYTSGTTSLPKGVVTTHANIEAQITTLVDAWEWSADDRILNILPLHHVHGIINVLSCALWSGACCVFLPKFDAAQVWEQLADGELTLFMAVPTIYYKLIAHWEQQPEAERVRLSAGARHLRLMVSGSAALPVSTLEQWQDITGHTLLERYGMTEIGMGLSNSYNYERRPGHVGKPLPGVQLRLADEQNEPIKEAGVPGQIQIKGPSVFKEYWQKPEATRAAFTADGWFLTGDVAELNEGYYRILGRDSVDIIKSGGYKISALEIEEVLRRHPAVEDCAVVGLPDPEWGQVVAAAVVSKNEIDAADLKTHLQATLPGYKVPRRYVRVEALPVNTLGKVTKKALAQYF